MSRIKRVLAGVLVTGAVATGTLALGVGSASAATTNWFVKSYYYYNQGQVQGAWGLCNAEVAWHQQREANDIANGGAGGHGWWCADGGTNPDGSGKVNLWESYTS
ncbi:hypothetical protein [Streptomyces sp. NPDC005231]|uniref:hypothetical protein n=1 Tax=Streptomyces sp. NPDC005231 TaxID=3157026 RepID=UPI0033AF11C8